MDVVGGNVATADGAPEAYERVEARERKRLIKEALGEMPAEFRAALTLVDLQGLSYQDAAEALGLPLGTVKSRLSRARNLLMLSLSRQPELFGADLRHNGERREEK